MEFKEEDKVGQVVAKNYKTAAVFTKYNIDFCCNGGISLKQACEKKGLHFDTLAKELMGTSGNNSIPNIEFDTWNEVNLIKYILDNHHSYIREKSPVIIQFLYKLCKVHGERHPELFEITNLFETSAKELHHHMIKEENILFPEILKLFNSDQHAAPYVSSDFGTIDDPIHMMENEHESEGERFRKIAQLSNHYITPADGCTTYGVAFEMLKEFESDLHMHIHLENNILFPKAQRREAQYQHNK